MNYIRKYRQILDKNQIATGVALLFLMFIQGFLETVSVSLIIPIMSIVMSPSEVLNNKILKFIYDFLRLNSMNGFLIVILLATILCYVLKNVFAIMHLFVTGFHWNRCLTAWRLLAGRVFLIRSLE